MQIKEEKNGVFSERSLFFKQVLFTVFVAVTIVMSVQTAFASALGTAGDYNVFVLKDFTASNSDVEGRLAAGGDVTLTSTAAGASFSIVTTTDTLVAGGNLTLTNGQINGNAVLGGTAALTGATITGATTENETGLSDYFAQAESYLTNLSNTLASIKPNGTTTLSGVNIKLTGDGVSSLQVFTVSAAQLLSGYSIALDGVPDGATVLINVSGASVSMSWYGMDTVKEIAGNVLFNFYEADSLTINGSLGGSILATSADIKANYGQIEGTVIAESWSGTTQVHDVPFEGTFSVAEPATLVLLFSGLIGLAGLKRRMKS